ncbi:energy-coupling factor transporter transmembrane component T [Christensenellaceae bacterium 44-20]
MKNVALGQYFPGSSLMHRMDPRVKLLLTLAIIVLIFFVHTYWGYLAVLGMLLLAVACSRISIKFVLKGIKPMWFVILLTFVMNIFFLTGEKILWEWGIIKIYWEGIEKAIELAIRLILLVMCSTILTLTTSPKEITDALESLLRPLKAVHFPVHEMALMMSIALRFIPTLMEETDRIMKAQTARGASFDSGGLMEKAKGMIPILVPLFVSAFKRADELALAMEARCYHGGDNRTRMKVFHVQLRDYLALLLFAGLCVFIGFGF